MAKKKVKKAESAKKVQLSAKEVLDNASKALTTFLKTNKLARDEDHSKNKKHGKEYKELSLAVEKAQEAMEDGNTKVAKTKPAKEAKASSGKGSAGRASVYEYPPGLTSAEKKEFRVKARKAAKAAEKGDKAPAASKSKKSEKETPAKKTSGGKKEVAKVETKEISKKKKKKVKKND